MDKVNYLQTNETIKSYLSNLDQKLRKLIEHIGDIKITISDNYFESLV